MPIAFLEPAWLWDSQVLMYESNWGLGLGNAIGWSALAEQTFSQDLSMEQIHVRSCVHLHMLDKRSGQLLAKWIVYRDDYLKQLFLSSSLLQKIQYCSRLCSSFLDLRNFIVSRKILKWGISWNEEFPEIRNFRKWGKSSNEDKWSRHHLLCFI